ncbi:MAG: hypothetical protein JRH11_08305 [Deltaproteobacteria bacterium]|nr:hypothetical protein [Deltaproteobacteria bacterium]
MSSNKLVVVPLALLVVAATGCMRFYPGTYIADPAAWAAVEASEQGFSVRMPGRPVVERGAQEAADGAPMTVVAAISTTYEMAFGFRVVEDRAGFDGHPMTDGAFVDLATGNTGGAEGAGPAPYVVQGHREIDGHGFPAEEAQLLDETTGIVTRIRVYRGKTRYYAAYVVHRSTDEERLAPLADAYFASMRMDPNDAPSPVGSGHLDPAGWRYIYPPEAAFAAYIPGEARHEVGNVTFGDERHPVNLYEVTDHETSFAVYEIRTGDRASSALLGELVESVAPSGTIERDASNVSCQGFAGREVRFMATDVTMRSRFFLTEGRIYEVRVVAPASSPIIDAPADRFFDSFRIL